MNLDQLGINPEMGNDDELGTPIVHRLDWINKINLNGCSKIDEIMLTINL